MFECPTQISRNVKYMYLHSSHIYHIRHVSINLGDITMFYFVVDKVYQIHFNLDYSFSNVTQLTSIDLFKNPKISHWLRYSKFTSNKINKNSIEGFCEDICQLPIDKALEFCFLLKQDTR